MSLARRTAALLALLLLLVPSVAVAAAPASFNEIEKLTMCIECNVPLNIAESAQADATRTEIRRLIAQGQDKKQVLDALVAEYGPNILAAPKAKGFNLLAYLVPVVAVVALVALGLVLLPRWRGDAKAAAVARDLAPAQPELDPRDARRLDAELAAFDR